jgi:small GTP-binding protein
MYHNIMKPSWCLMMELCAISMTLIMLASFTAGVSCDINIILVGNAGVGKSSLINYLIDENLAPIGEYTTGTTEVNVYSIIKYGNRFRFYDTPGLNDLENSNFVPRQIADNIHSINIIIFCIDLSANRLYNHDIGMIQEYKKKFGPEIMKYAIVAFTKSNLNKRYKDIGEKRRDILMKHTGNIPFLHTFDSGFTNEWMTVLWHHMATYSRENSYFMKSSYYKINLCDPMKQVMTNMPDNGFPKNTDIMVTKHYHMCVENSIQQHRREQERNAAMGGFLAVAGAILLGVATGGAGLLGGLAAFGGGSIAAGGLGIAGGVVTLTTLGVSTGLVFTQYQHRDCIAHVIQHMNHEINMRHYDYYLYSTKMVAFEGEFINNKPNGAGTAKDEHGDVIWSGNFINGIADICRGV